MGEMYPHKRLNMAIGALSIVAAAAFFLLIRHQVAVTDSQFLRSMIPHHAGAILKCEEAPVHKAKIKELCNSIISSQQAEIRQMKDLLQR